MWAIAKHESIGLLKSIKSILILVFLLSSAYAGIWIASKTQNAFGLFPDDETKIFTAGLSFTIFSFGPLFAMILSHDAFNREIEHRTMRFIVTKIRRTDIVLGKALGHLLFWITMLIASNGLIFMFSKTYSARDFIETVSFISTFVAFALLLSMLIRKPILSSFLSMLFGIAIPTLSLWAIFSDKWYISYFKYVTPYYYVYKESMFFLVNFAFVALLIVMTIFIFKRRDF